MGTKGITHKDLTKQQLEALKEIYIERRINDMSEDALRKFAKDVLQLQVRGTVGNEEEKEVWKEMEEHFKEDFGNQIKTVIKMKGNEEEYIPSKEEEFQKRLEVLEQRKSESSNKNEDMW